MDNLLPYIQRRGVDFPAGIFTSSAGNSNTFQVLSPSNAPSTCSRQFRNNFLKNIVCNDVCNGASGGDGPSMKAERCKHIQGIVINHTIGVRTEYTMVQFLTLRSCSCEVIRLSAGRWGDPPPTYQAGTTYLTYSFCAQARSHPPAAA